MAKEIIVRYKDGFTKFLNELASRLYNKSPRSGPSYDDYKIKNQSREDDYDYYVKVHSSGIIIQRWVCHIKLKELDKPDIKVSYWGYGDYAKSRAKDIREVIDELAD